MLRSAGTRRAVPAVLVPVAVAVLVAVLASGGVAAAKSTKSPKTPPTQKLVQVGHGTFWECHGKTTQILVGVNTLTLHPGSTLNIDFVVRNEAAAECNYVAPYSGQAPGPDLDRAPGRAVRLHRLRDRRRPPQERLARPAGLQLPGPGLRPAATLRHRVRFRQLEPGQAGQLQPRPGRQLHPRRRRALRLPAARRLPLRARAGTGGPGPAWPAHRRPVQGTSAIFPTVRRPSRSSSARATSSSGYSVGCTGSTTRPPPAPAGRPAAHAARSRAAWPRCPSRSRSPSGCAAAPG